MNARRKSFVFTVAVGCTLLTVSVQAKDPADSLKGHANQLSKTSGLPTYAVLTINNLTSWMRYDGHSNHSPGGDDGVYFPRGTGSIIYQDCLLWGGKVYTNAALTSPGPFHVVRAGGGAYGIGTTAGSILGSGSTATRENPSDASVRIFKIRRNYFSMSQDEASRDAATVNEIKVTAVSAGHIELLKSQYAFDWEQWPVAKGAPYIDRNGNGIYDPPPPFSDSFTVDSLYFGGYDEPGVSGPYVSMPAEQVIFTVYNDLSVYQSSGFSGSEPMGLEVQKTMWGYGKINGLNNAYFTRYRIINKGGVDTSAQAGDQMGSFWIDSMYIAQWSDPDLGDAGDDLAGCDTVLNMGYVYNRNDLDAEFRGFSLPPPAVGYDYLAGPAVLSPGDSAVVNFRRRMGSKNLSMTSFGYFAPGDPFLSPTSTYNEGTGRWWKLLRGFVSVGNINTADQYYATPPGIAPSKYPLSGDPIERTGWLDGQGEPWSYTASDKRIVLSSGPFRMAPGDTQEVYLALVAGLGADRISSISVMKANDMFVQTTFNNLLSLPIAPTVPKIKAVALNGEIILEWGSQLQQVQFTEQVLSGGTMKFEGYEVLELPTAKSPISEGVRVATHDLVNNSSNVVEWNFDPELGITNPTVIHWGTNSGIRRWHRVTKSYIDDPQGTRLLNGKEYHFAVTAYSVNVTYGEWPVTLSSTPIVITAKPQIPFGMGENLEFGDTIAVSHTAGTSTARILPIVIDPFAGTGERYLVGFSGPPEILTWSVSNLSTGTTLATGLVNHTGDEDYLMVAGALVKVIADSTSLLTTGDLYEFSSSMVTKTSPAVEASIGRIGVYPNPYYGDREQISNSREQSVTFTNLPERAIFRIFNLSGHLVRTIRKDDTSQFIKWDLKNEYERYVGSGIYICHIELPDLNRAKVLKVAIITGERIAQPQ